MLQNFVNKRFISNVDGFGGGNSSNNGSNVFLGSVLLLLLLFCINFRDMMELLSERAVFKSDCPVKKVSTVNLMGNNMVRNDFPLGIFLGSMV